MTGERTLTVYIWPLEEDLEGHSSIRLSDGTYMGYCHGDPIAPGIPECKSRIPGSLEEDIINEGNRQPEVIQIPEPEGASQAMKDFWEQYKDNTYNFITNNCATAMYLVLKTGYPYLKVFDKGAIIWVPKAIKEMVKGMAIGETYFTEENVMRIVGISMEEALQIAKSKNWPLDKPPEGMEDQFPDIPT